MAEKVHASVSVNPLATTDKRTSGMLTFAMESSALDIGYGEYRQQDYRIGFTKEINKVYSLDKSNPSVGFMYLADGIIDNPLDDFDDQNTDRTDDAEPGHLDFMPMLEIKSDTYPRGLTDLPETNPKRVKAERLAKTMGMDLETLVNAFTTHHKIPQEGTAEWSKAMAEYRKGGGTKTSSAYRTDLTRDQAEKRKHEEDLTDVSIGYFGRFGKDNIASPAATLYTYLACLEKTVLESGGTSGTPGTPQPGDVSGKVRKFKLSGPLFAATYTLNGYMLREVEGVIKGNKHAKRGYSSAEVWLEKERPLAIKRGILTHHSDFNQTDNPYFAKPAGIPSMYVSLQIQLDTTKFLELVMVDLYQETTIEGNGKIRRSNSGHQSESEKEMTWTEAYIAESFIPLTRTSMLKVKMFDRGNLLLEVKCHFIQMVNVTKEKWYQTKLFQAVIRVAGFLISLFSGGTLAPLMQILVQMAIQLAITFAITYLIKVLVRLGILDAKVALAILAIVAIYGISTGAAWAELDFSLITTATRLVEATGKVFAEENAMANEEHKKKMAELQKKITAEEEKNEELRDAMHTSSDITILKRRISDSLAVIDRPLSETGSQFLARTTNANPVADDLSYDALKARMNTILV